jgi:NYN domain
MEKNKMADQLAVFIDFENVAIWAEQEFYDFELTPLMEYLQSRGPVVIKRAYGDWSRFSRYRDEMMNNAIDLTQIYAIRAGKNRADIRMAMDALETAMTKSQINTFVIVSGDSDFGPLVTKLREYGRYTLGIGPRNIAHHLLVKSCDEFVFLETVLGETNGVNERLGPEQVTAQIAARRLLLRALQVHGQRGEVPVLASKLKQTLLLMDPTFNEVNFGYDQFKTWLDDQRNTINLLVKEMQLYVAPKDFVAQGGYVISSETDDTSEDGSIKPNREISLEQQYRQIFNRLKMTAVDFTTRRDVLRDIYRELRESPGRRTADELLEELRLRYESQGLIRSKTMLRQIWQMGFRQRAFDYRDGQTTSFHVPVWLAEDIDSEATFVSRAEAGFVYAVINAGLEIDLAELANILIDDRRQTAYIQALLEDLVARGRVLAEGDRYQLVGRGAIPFWQEAPLQAICLDIDSIELPESISMDPHQAQALAQRAMVERSQDFAASSASYLLAARVQAEAVKAGEEGATLEDLRWYMASYASVKAGELSQVHHNYAGSRPYYLAFFSLVQEDDPLWGRMRGLINPMLSYYWANAGRELGANIVVTGSTATTPVQVAVLAATHPNSELRSLWETVTRALAAVNPTILRRVVNQLRMNQNELVDAAEVANKIDAMLIE